MMLRAGLLVTLAIILTGAGAWAQGGAKVSPGRQATVPAPVRHVPVLKPGTQAITPPFGSPAPQRFSASPFPDPNRALGQAIRHDVFHSHPPAAVPVFIFPIVPYVPYAPYGYGPYGEPYADTEVNGSAPADSGQYAAPAQTQPAPAAPNSDQIAASATPDALAADTSAVMFQSSPEGADIVVDGNFMGNTPSTVRLAAGDHTISIQKSGFSPYERTITVTAGGVISFNASLQAQ